MGLNLASSISVEESDVAVLVAERIEHLKEPTEAPPLPVATPEAPDTPRKFRSARKGTDEAKETHQKT